ncbi:uncharacterized protein METZ01_LOCUS268965 [marine metagenome]|uniref:Uncharacterized protein n=1 Tax=marine metagenome TaxID=408172 RepID=A0A382K0B0_9ZZZZ
MYAWNPLKVISFFTCIYEAPQKGGLRPAWPSHANKVAPGGMYYNKVYIIRIQ